MKINSVTIHNIGKLVFGENSYNSIYSYFNNINNCNNYKYKVAATKRCFNLCYALSDNKDQKDQKDQKEAVISSDALLINAREIAEEYNINGEFPSILICDDILFYGDTIIKLLYKFEQIVVHYLKNEFGWADTLSNTRIVHSDLVKSIDIKVYAMNKIPKFVDNSFLWKVESELNNSDSELLKTSERMSLFLNRINIASTNNTISVEMQNSDKYKNSEIFITEDYRGTEYKFYMQDIDVLGTKFKNIIQIYSNDFYKIDSSNRVIITSNIVYGKINSDSFDKLCSVLAKYKPITDIMVDKQLNSIKMQYISSIISMISLSDFCKDIYDTDDIIECSDIDKITLSVINIKTLLNNKDTLESIRKDFGIKYNKAINSLNTSVKNVVALDKENIVIEDYICKLGMLLDKHNFDCWRNIKRVHITETLEEPGISSIKDFIQSINENIQISNDAALMKIMMFIHDWYVTVDNLEVTDGEIQFIFRVDSYSTFILPRRYHNMIPALIIIWDNSWMVDLKPLEATIKFIDALKPRENADEREINTLNDFKNKWIEYVKILDYCNKSVARWNFGLSTENEARQYSKKSFVEYLINDLDIQDYYNGEANKFLDN